MFAGRQEGNGDGKHFRQARGDSGQDRAERHIRRIGDAIGLEDEHPPVPSVIGGDRGLLLHDLMEARDLGQALGDRQGLVADLGPGADKSPAAGKMPVEIEHRRRLDAAVIDLADEIGGTVVENRQMLPLAPLPRGLKCLGPPAEPLAVAANAFYPGVGRPIAPPGQSTDC